MPLDFGKFKGLEVDDPSIPTSYIEWLLRASGDLVDNLEVEAARRGVRRPVRGDAARRQLVERTLALEKNLDEICAQNAALIDQVRRLTQRAERTLALEKKLDEICAQNASLVEQVNTLTQRAERAEAEVRRYSRDQVGDGSMVERIVQTGFRELAKRYHPDVGGNAAEMRELLSAKRRINLILWK